MVSDHANVRLYTASIHVSVTKRHVYDRSVCGVGIPQRFPGIPTLTGHWGLITHVCIPFGKPHAEGTKNHWGTGRASSCRNSPPNFGPFRPVPSSGAKSLHMRPPLIPARDDAPSAASTATSTSCDEGSVALPRQVTPERSLLGRSHSRRPCAAAGLPCRGGPTLGIWRPAVEPELRSHRAPRKTTRTVPIATTPSPQGR